MMEYEETLTHEMKFLSADGAEHTDRKQDYE